MKKHILIITFIILVLPLILSLQITPSSFTINKTTDVNKDISFDILNNDNITLFNISFEDNPHITFPLISQLSVGETAVVNADIFGNQDFSGSLRIKSFFQSDLGQSFKTVNISVTFSGVDTCSLTLIEGDSVLFKNLESDDITLKNADTGEFVQTIPPNSDYNINFDTPKTFRYFFTNLGVPITQICRITSLSTTGLVNDPNKDGMIDLTISIDFLPTTLEITTLNDNYEILPTSSTQDILNIKNIGSNDAKNVKLSGDWFSFTNNNFNLNPGQSINIGYTISPNILKTNETNQTYNKSILVEGNFPVINQTFSIFIPFRLLDLSIEDIIGLEELMRNKLVDVRSYCNENSNRLKDFCIIFRQLADNNIINQNISNTEVIIEIANAIREIKAAQTKDINENKIIRNQTTSALEDNTIINNGTSTRLSLIEDSISGIASSVSFVIIGVLGSSIIIGLIWIALYQRNKKKDELNEDYY